MATTRFTDTYLLYLLAQASGQASAEFHGWLASEGIAVPTWRILATLYPDAPAGIGELARSCLAKQSTMTRRVDRLVDLGLVERCVVDGDRRRVEVSLTAPGRALADRLTRMARQHEARILRGRSTEETAALKAVLRSLLAG